MQIHSSRSVRGGTRLPVILALLVIAGGGVLAYRHFFQRPGEAATNLIPADALMVATLDLTPAPDQVPLFKRIEEALKTERVDTKAEQAMTDALAKSSLAKDLRPTFAHNFAFAVLKPQDGNQTTAKGDFVLFASLKERAQAQKALEQDADAQTHEGFTYYRARNDGKTCLSLLDNYLLIADKPATFARIRAVHDGKTASIATLPDYQEARATLPAAANFVALIAPEGLRQIEHQALTVQANATFTLPQKWVALGATLRDQGLEIDVQAPVASSQDANMQAMATVAPIDADTLCKRLPAGAYGVATMAQVSKYWEVTSHSLHSHADLSATMDRGIAEFQKETGLDVEHDIVPAFGGNCTLAVYPDGPNAQNGIDGLLLLDDANGADPATLADKVRPLLLREINRDNANPVQLVSETRDGATVWTLDNATDSRMHQQFASGGNPELRRYTADKTLAYAQIGHAFLLATSRDLLDRALAAYQHGTGALASDPAYVSLRTNLLPDSQSLLMINLPAIMDTLRPMLNKSLSTATNGVTPEDVAGLFGTTGLVGTQQFDGKIWKAKLFLPVNYGKAIHLFNSIGNKPAGSPPHAGLLQL